MKKLSFIASISLIVPLSVHAQSNKGNVITDTLYSENLENDFGEVPSRMLPFFDSYLEFNGE